MSNNNPESRQPVLLKVPDTASLPDGAAQVEETQKNEPNLPELGVQLEAVARRVARSGDVITNEARELALTWSVGAVLLIAPALSTSVSKFISPATITGACAGMGALFLYRTGVYVYGAAKRADPVQIPDGGSIQCLRANKTGPPFKKGEVVSFVHPREAGGQTADQARGQLREALDVVEAAPTVAKVVLPGFALSTGLVRLHNGGPYNKTVEGLEPDIPAVSPYKDSEISVVLDRGAAKRLAESLRGTQEYPLLQHTIDALAERFPSAILKLTEAADDNKRLVPLLHTLLRQVIYGELPGVQREWLTDGFARKVNLTTTIDRTNPYDPLIVQHSDANALIGDARRLSQLTRDIARQITDSLKRAEERGKSDPQLSQMDSDGVKPTTEELITDILTRLKNGNYSDLELVSIALHLAEQRQKKIPVGALPDAKVPRVDLPTGASPAVIRPMCENYKVIKRVVGRILGRSALAGFTGALIWQGLAIGMDAHDTPLQSPAPAPTIVSQDIWRVDEHLMESAGYYTQNIKDTFDASTAGWDGHANYKWEEQLPLTLPDPNQPHLTVSGVTNDSHVDLAIREGTMLSAISAETQNGQQIKTAVYIRSDGTRVAYVDNQEGQLYRLTYKLTSDDNQKKAPFADRPLRVADPRWNDIRPSLFPGPDKSSARSMARYISGNFTYDASSELRDRLDATRKAGDYLRIVYDGGRCDCLECATAAVLLAERTKPGQEALLATGYINDYDFLETNHSYLDPDRAHAWAVGSGGEIMDATAIKTDERSDAPKRMSVAERDAQMQDGGWRYAQEVVDAAPKAPAAPAPATDNKENRSSWDDLKRLLISGISIAAAAGLWREMRRRTLTNGALSLTRHARWLANSAVVSPDKAVSAMAWHAYSDGSGSMPVFGPDSKPPQVDNIPTSSLQEIADGALRADPQFTRREGRAIQRMASLILAERRRFDRGV